MDNVAQGSHRELGLPVIERVRYCQQHRDSVKKIPDSGIMEQQHQRHGIMESIQLLLSTYKVSQRNFVFFSQA